VTGPADDDTLHAAWLAGDDAAFDSLVERHGRAVLGFLRTLVGGQAEDVWSESWLRVLRARHRYEPSGHYRAWLFTIARRCAQDHQRGARRWFRLRAAAEFEVPPPPPPNPERHLRLVQQKGQVSDALATLSAQQQAIVRLTYAEGLSSAVIGEILGLSDQQVRNKLTYARRLLRERLQEE